MLNYEKGKQAAKIEISKRKGLNSYEFKSYLGVSMLTITKGDAVAGKLAALLTRKKFAMRDVFDTWYFPDIYSGNSSASFFGGRKYQLP